MARHSALRPGPPETNLKFSHLRSLEAEHGLINHFLPSYGYLAVRSQRDVGGRVLLWRVRAGQRIDTGGNRPHDRRTGGRRPADHSGSAGHGPDHTAARGARCSGLPGSAEGFDLVNLFRDPNVMPTSVDGVYRQPQQVLYPAPSTRHANPAKLNTNQGKAVPGQRNSSQQFVVHGGALLRSSPAGATRRMGELERTWTSR